MKWTNRAGMLLFLFCLSAPLMHGQDLSKYRSFSFGSSLADIAKQISKTPADAVGMREGPALLQLTWWPPASLLASPREFEPLRQIRFFFYNGVLFRMASTYDNTAIRGLTTQDMVRAMTAKYGPASSSAGKIADSDGTTESALAHWEDSQYSFNLIRSSLSGSFELVMFVKAVDVKAAMADTAENLEAPRRELALEKKDAEELDAVRQKNLKTFLP
jgi:hypothetical protein